MPRADTTPKGPGGRPKKLDTERRIERSECRLTLAEKQFVRDQAKLAGITEAEYARMYPQAKLGVRIGGIFPVQVKAENLLICMTAWSFLGSFSRLRSDIGHAAHLGGLLFGVAYHALFLRPRRHHHHQQQQLYFAYQ